MTSANPGDYIYIHVIDSPEHQLDGRPTFTEGRVYAAKIRPDGSASVVDDYDHRTTLGPERWERVP